MPPKAVAKGAAKAGARSKSPAGRGASAKSPGTAGAPAKAAAKPKAAAEAVEPPAPVDEGPLTAKQAERLVSSIRPADLAALAESVDEAEQLPVRMALEFVGDKDLTWANAQASLRTGATFLKEILDMEAGDFITRAGLGRMAELGSLDVAALEGKNEAARALAIFLDACICGAKDRLGINAKKGAPPPAPDEEPPAWPLKIDFKELPKHIAEAVRWRKTPLIVSNGKAKEVDTFLTYSAYVQLDAKWILGETTIRKTMSMEDMRADLRRRVVGAMKNGLPLHIAMANTAVAFKSQICAEELFPSSVFKFGLFQDLSQPEEEQEYKKMIRESDLGDWVGAFPGRIKDGFFTVVTTDFGMDSAAEHLPDALPYFDDMAVLEIDTASFS